MKKKISLSTKAVLSLILSAVLFCLPVGAFLANSGNAVNVHAEDSKEQEAASEEPAESTGQTEADTEQSAEGGTEESTENTTEESTENGTVSGNEVTEPVCTCEKKCSAYDYDKDCEVCAADYRDCEYKTPNVVININSPGGWYNERATVTFTVSDAAHTGNFEIAMIQAKVGQNGSWTDVTEDKKLEISENCTVYVQVTDQKGNTYERNRAMKCFDTTKPTLNAAVSDGLLSIQVHDTDSGAKAVYVNGYEFTDLTNGTLNIRLQQFDAGYEYFTISAMDNAGNMSEVYKTKNPYYKDPADESDENPAEQLPVNAEATKPGSATGTVTEHTKTDSDGNTISQTPEEQKKQAFAEADAAEAAESGDGRKLALDQRLINDMLPDDGNSKAANCVEKAYGIWEQTKEQKSAQLIFCDLSTPKGDGTFNVYEDIRDKLMAKGVPENEIAFIHDANTETRKAELFAKVRSGQVRFLLGSTQKMGAGTNVQDRLISLHHLDVPWRPSDIEQQEGRILRQGNMNDKVKIFRYVTEGTFDSYSWQLIENKQKFIGQIMTSKSPVRSCEDVDEAALTYAEVKALATGNPYIKEKMDLDIQVSKLKLMKANHTSQKYRLEDNIAKHYPQQITILKERISGMQADIQTAKAKLPADKEQFFMKVGDKAYTDKKEAGAALVEMCKEMKTVNVPATVGEYAGFKMAVSFDSFNHKFVMNLKGQLSHNLEIGSDPLGNIARINHALESMPKQLAEAQTKLENVEHQLETAKVEVQKPFAQEQELAEKLERLSALNALLNMDEKGNDGIGMEDEPETSEGNREVADCFAKNIPLAEKLTDIGQDKGGRQYADAPAARVSLKEKLEAMKVKAAGGDAEKTMPKKVKGREEAL